MSTLEITIEEMNTLPGEWRSSILRWGSKLPYLWCPPDLPVLSAPGLPAIQDQRVTLGDVTAALIMNLRDERARRI